MPSAKNGDDVLNVPVVTLTGNTLLVDGQYAGTVRDGMKDMPELEAVLRQRRATWPALQPRAPLPREILIRADRDTPAWVLKKIVSAIVGSGFETFSFMVEKA